MKDKQLTANFRLSEFIDLNNPPSLRVLGNIQKLATELQKVRNHFKRRITITSGYRPPAHNAQVGGVSNSAHCDGTGCDFVIEGVSLIRAYMYMDPWWPAELGLYQGHIHAAIAHGRDRWISKSS
jgi:hypothetical protein